MHYNELKQFIAFSFEKENSKHLGNILVLHTCNVIKDIWYGSSMTCFLVIHSNTHITCGDLSPYSNNKQMFNISVSHKNHSNFCPDDGKCSRHAPVCCPSPWHTWHSWVWFSVLPSFNAKFNVKFNFHYSLLLVFDSQRWWIYHFLNELSIHGKSIWILMFSILFFTSLIFRIQQTWYLCSQ